MTPDQITITLPTSKRLKELGVKQESYFYHQGDEMSLYTPNCRCDSCKEYCSKMVSAFTAEEIGELLPVYIRLDYFYDLRITKTDSGGWKVYYEFNNIEKFISFHKSLTEALALTFIQLKEKGII